MPAIETWRWEVKKRRGIPVECTKHNRLQRQGNELLHGARFPITSSSYACLGDAMRGILTDYLSDKTEVDDSNRQLPVLCSYYKQGI